LLRVTGLDVGYGEEGEVGLSPSGVAPVVHLQRLHGKPFGEFTSSQRGEAVSELPDTHSDLIVVRMRSSCRESQNQF
jgi:hypothetical protein